MSKAKVIEMFERATKVYPSKELGTWKDTPRRRLARERNWCIYVLRGTQCLLVGTLKRFHVSKMAVQNLERTLASLEFSIDKAYYDELDKLQKRGK